MPVTLVDDNVNDMQDAFAEVSDRDQRQIQIRADALHLIASEGEEALVAAGAPLYVRGGIVRPIVDELPAAHGRRTKVARLRDVDTDCLIDWLSRSATWSKWSLTEKKLKPTDPPRNVALTILSRDGEWKFRRLSGVTTTPTLRPDGTVLSKAGYDEATQLLLLDPPALPAMPDRPTRADGLAAIATLNNLLDEFPFVDEASRSAALSAIITPVARGAIAVAPMHAVTAPVPGSGKSYILDIAACISTGDLAAVLTAAAKDEETEKRLGAALLNGQSIISIDNVNGELGGDLLCQMIERPMVAVRPLGSSQLVKVENRACVYATGNNIRLIGDMTRRVILCSLDPDTERPELRTFTTDPLDMVRADRGKYIAAALTICRSYAIAGYPSPCKPLASFGDWSKIVRSALVWLEQVDPVSTMDAARADDPVTSMLSNLFASWHLAVQSEWRSAAEIKRDGESDWMGSFSHPELNQALKEVARDRSGAIDAGNLGRFLGKHKGRIVEGYKLLVDDDKHAKKKIWSVVKVE